MSFGYSSGGGPYEQWTVRLRAWSRDATTTFDGLPRLTEDSFDQATFMRLIATTEEAIRLFMESWKAELERSFQHAHTTHALGIELVRLRQLLRSRLTLAQHPGWPEPIRTALTDGLRQDLAAIQSDLEAVAGRSSARGSFDRARTDELVALIRRNPLTTLLPTEPTAPPAPVPSSVTGRSARRILF